MPPFARSISFALFLVSTSLFADVSVIGPWVRGTVAGQGATGAFMSLRSSEDATLIEARSPVAALVEIHAMSREGNVMKMRALPGLELPAGKTVELRPGGNHIMLMELRKPLSKGDMVPLILVVEGKDKKRHTIEVRAEVHPLAEHSH